MNLRFLIFTIVIFYKVAQSVGDENKLVQINLRKSINILSDKFISFSIDDQQLQFSKFPIHSRTFSSRLRALGPGYIRTPVTQKFFPVNETQNDVDGIDVNDDDWKSFYEWIRSIGMYPVFSIPYYPKLWQPKMVLRILAKAYKLGITNCVWQLGIDFHGTSAMKYSDDLHTIQLMIDSFPSHKVNWTIITAEISFGSDSYETKRFIKFVEDAVEAVGWMEPTEYSSNEADTQSDTSLQIIINSKIPIWASISPATSISESSIRCGSSCLEEGLEWAKILGYAGKTGFSVVFKKLQLAEIRQPSLSYFISLVHKKTVGRKMFDTRSRPSDKLTSQFFTFCSKNNPGAITIMGINFEDSTCKISPKLGNKYSANEIYQYIFSVQDEWVQLNGLPIYGNVTELKPLVKSKRGNRNIRLTLPARSVGFWELSYGKCEECLQEDESNLKGLMSNTPSQNSIGLLLQDLIWSSVKNEDKPRVRRNTSSRKSIRKKDKKEQKERLQKFLLKPDITVDILSGQNHYQISKKETILQGASPFRRFSRHKRDLAFQNFLNLPNFGISEPIFGIPEPNPLNMLIPKDIAAEEIFKSRDNPNIPVGDVTGFEVGDDEVAEHDQDYDYVAFDDDHKKPGKTNHLRTNVEYEEPEDVDGNFAYAPNEYYEQLDQQFPKYDEKPTCENCKEMWEGDSMISYYGNQQNVKSLPPPPNQGNNVANLQYIVRELEPTYQQNQENLRKTASLLKTYYADPPKTSNEFLPFGMQQYPQEFEDEVDDDDFFARRSNRRRHSTPFKISRHRRSPESTESHQHFNNQILNAVEEIVERLEDGEKPEKSKTPKKFDQTKDGLKKKIIKRDLLEKLKSQSPIDCKQKFNIQKPKLKPIPPFPKMDLAKKIHRFRRNAIGQKSISSWEASNFFNEISKDLHPQDDIIDDLMKVKPLLKTIKFHDEEGKKIQEVVQVYQLGNKNGLADNYDDKKSYYQYLQSFVQNVSHSFGELVKNSHRYISGWWKVFN